MTPKNYRSGMLATCAAVALLSASMSAAQAEEWSAREFTSPERPLAEALLDLSDQYDISLVAPQELLRGKRAPALAGTYTSNDALVRMLQGSGLSYQRNADGAVIITRQQRQSAVMGDHSGYRKVAVTTEGSQFRRTNVGKPIARMAQAQPNTATDAPSMQSPSTPQPLEEIMVTGSRIARTGMQTPTPVTSIDASDLQNMAPTTLIDALDQMPQFLGNQTAQTQSFATSGAAGASFASLRGLSPQRTLNLLDGRRIVPATRSGAPDISLLPEELIQRVEVVTGGASAAYGSDAVAGVVNYILNTDYEGFRGHVQGGMTEIGDAENFELGGAWGTRVGDRGHLIASAEYFHGNGVEDYSDRDWFDSTAMIRNTDPNGPTYITGHNVHGGNFTWGGVITDTALAGTQFDDNGDPIPFDPGEQHTSTSQIGGSGFDSGEYQWMTADQKRFSAFSHFKYDLTDNLTAFVQGHYGYSRTGFESAPAAMWGSWPATIYRENPYLPQSIQDQMDAAGVTSFHLGKMQSDEDLGSPYVTNTNKMFQLTAGFDGDLDSNWHYNAYYQYGKNQSTLLYDNVARIDRMYQALDTVRDPATGQIVCYSTYHFDPNDGCVPLNPFGVGTTSQEAKDWIMGAQKEQYQVIKQQVAEASISGDVFDNWAGTVSLATGASYRKEHLLSEPRTNPAGLEELSVPTMDEITYRGLPGSYYGNASIFERTVAADLEGGYDVWEVFGETIVPLARDITMIQNLDLNAAVRYADYSGSGGIWAWKLGLDWQLYNDLRLRGTLSRDIRAGTLAERYDFSGSGATVDDTITGAEAVSISVDQTGNPNVDPEKADTLTFGAVYQPSYLQGFSVSVDYFDIKIKGAISRLSTQDIIDDCAAGSQELCDLISRDETGQISRIQSIYLNIDEFRTRGIDFELQYNTPVSLFGGDEDLTLRGFATRMLELSRTVPGGVETDTNGQTGWGGGSPKWQVNASANYRNGPFGVFVQERYIGSGLKRSEDYWVEGVDVDDNHVPSRFYTNLRLSYDFQAKGGSWTAFANVTNLLDQKPPFGGMTYGFFGSTYTNESLFDVLGRRYTVGLRFEY